MAIRKIVKAPNSVLNKKCKTVTIFDDRLCTLLDDMKETMERADGAGLAGPQVGILKRICIIEANGMYVELINPEIISQSGKELMIEGCLSVENITGYVFRPTTVTVKAQDRYGIEFVLTGHDILAQAISHETDHLVGVLFTSKMEREE